MITINRKQAKERLVLWSCKLTKLNITLRLPFYSLSFSKTFPKMMFPSRCEIFSLEYSTYYLTPEIFLAENHIDWGEWTDWGPCSVSCETGWTTRHRPCIDTVTGDVMSPGDCFGHDVEYQSCTLQSCPRKY